MEHTLPKFWTATEYDCIRVDFDDLNGCILFGKDSREHARLIAAAPELLDACKNAVQRMSDSPVQACGEWETGLFCGLEDRNITDRYDACMHGYEKALERVQEWIIDEIEAAIAKATT